MRALVLVLVLGGCAGDYQPQRGPAIPHGLDISTTFPTAPSQTPAFITMGSPLRFR